MNAVRERRLDICIIYSRDVGQAIIPRVTRILADAVVAASDVISSKPIGVNCFLFRAGRRLEVSRACNFNATPARSGRRAHAVFAKRGVVGDAPCRAATRSPATPSTANYHIPPVLAPRYMFLVGFGPDSPAPLYLINRAFTVARARATRGLPRT